MPLSVMVIVVNFDSHVDEVGEEKLNTEGKDADHVLKRNDRFTNISCKNTYGNVSSNSSRLSLIKIDNQHPVKFNFLLNLHWEMPAKKEFR